MPARSPARLFPCVTGMMRISRFITWICIGGEDDLFSAGVLDHLEEKNTLSVIEWADRANGSLSGSLTIGFSYGAAANERIITLPAILAEGL